jgi:hypothetical protein
MALKQRLMKMAAQERSGHSSLESDIPPKTLARRRHFGPDDMMMFQNVRIIIRII